MAFDLDSINQHSDFPVKIDEPEYVNNLSGSVLDAWMTYQNLMNEAVASTDATTRTSKFNQAQTLLENNAELKKCVADADLINKMQDRIIATQVVLNQRQTHQDTLVQADQPAFADQYTGHLWDKENKKITRTESNIDKNTETVHMVEQYVKVEDGKGSYKYDKVMIENGIRDTKYAYGDFSIVDGIACSASGNYGYARGYRTAARGDYSSVSGYKPTALGQYSHAEGGASNQASDTYTSSTPYLTVYTDWAKTKFSLAQGAGSHVEGRDNFTYGTYSHAEGNQTIAKGESSHAEGCDTIAVGTASHAEGEDNQANGYASHAEGGASIANGRYSHAEGNSTTEEIASNSHAEGDGSVAKGVASHAEGNSIAASYCSHSEGNVTRAVGYAAHAEGSKTTTLDDYSHVEGLSTTQANTSYNSYTSASTIYNDWLNAGSSSKFSIAKGDASHVEGQDSMTLADQAHAEGFRTVAVGSASHSEGGLTTATGTRSHAEGSETHATGQYSHSECESTRAVGYAAHAEGSRTTALGAWSHAEGYSYKTANSDYKESTSDNTIISEWKSSPFALAKGGDSHVEGINCLALGSDSHAEGNQTIASSYSAHAEGNQTIASNYSAHAEGYKSTASGSYSHAEGYSCTASGGDSHAEGSYSTASDSYSHAEGYSCTASGYAAHAEGYKSTASGDYSHAGGLNSVAKGYASYATGAYTTAQGRQFVIGHYNTVMAEPGGNSIGAIQESMFILGNGGGTSTSLRSNAFRVTGTGQVYAKKSTINTGADYAEYCEWEDKNQDNEVRYGYFVTDVGVLEDGSSVKVRKAKSGEYIYGIVSANPTVIGNGDECWNGRFIRDEWGDYIMEETTETVKESRLNEETGEIEEIEKEVTCINYKQNPDYDPDKEYTQRSDRPEWDAIGMVGILTVRDDGTCKKGEWCCSNDEGIATACSRGQYDTFRVVDRIADNLIKVRIG